MRFLSVVLVALQVLYCYGQKLNPYSALSCAVGFSTHYSILNGQLRFIKSTSDDSVESNVFFKLFTQEHKDGLKISLQDLETLKNNFKSNRPTRIITHGYLSNGTDPVCMDPMRAFLEKDDFNVIVMDWYNYQLAGNSFPMYWEVTKKVKPVGLYLANLINTLEELGMDTNTTGLIGHSLGAHIVGIAGYHAKNKIYHVVGLDPAEPEFEDKLPGDRVSKEDATHVEIIHTNGKHCGLAVSVGHYDFYANGGSKQPGCKKNVCSHSRAYEYYTESIRSPTGFYGKLCHKLDDLNEENCNGVMSLMGGKMRSHAMPGVYLVETNDKSPFAKGKGSC